jgi:hypothetical protein
MAAAKNAETPSLRDLSREVEKAAIKARAELDDCRARLGEMRGQREQLLAAPLHHTDMADELARHLKAQGREVLHYLRGQLTEMRNKSASMAVTAPDQQAIYSPIDKARAADLLPILLDPEESARRLLAAVGDLPTEGEGLPLEQRREAVAALDQKIQAAEQHEGELIAGLTAAGINLPIAA